jgi:hypothetical protein
MLLDELLDILHTRCATVEHFKVAVDARDQRSDAIHSYGLLKIIAAECSTLEPAPAEQRRTPDELRHLERIRAARSRGEGQTT